MNNERIEEKVGQVAKMKVKILNIQKGLKTYECREARIHVDRPIAVHADGESCLCQDDIQVQCIEKKLRVIV